MAALLSRRPGGLLVLPLPSAGRFQLAATGLGPQRYGLALIWRFPSSVPMLANPHDPTHPWMSMAEYQQAVVAAARVEFAPDAQSVTRVAAVALDGGSREADAARMAEALSLFRNLDRISDAAFEACRTDCVAIVDAYWRIVDFWMGGAVEPITFTAGDAHLVLKP